MGEKPTNSADETTPKKKRHQLTTQEIMFCAAIAAKQSRSQAYITAYGEWVERGGKRFRRSLTTARQKASRLLKKGYIQRELERARDEVTKSLRMDAKRWMRRIIERTAIDPLDLYEPDPDTGLPTPKKLSDLTPAQRRIVKGVKVKRRRVSGKGGLIEEVENAEYITHDPYKADELIGKHLGFLKDPEPLVQLLALLPSAAQDVIKRALVEATAQQQPAALPSPDVPHLSGGGQSVESGG